MESRLKSVEDWEPTPPRQRTRPSPLLEPEGDSIDPRQILAALWGGRWTIAATAMIFALLSYLSVIQETPVFRSTATMLFDSQRANVMTGEDVIAQQEFTSETLQNQIEILRSTSLIDRVVDELGLDRNPTFNPTLQPPEPMLVDRLPPGLSEMLARTGFFGRAPVPSALDPDEVARRERLDVISQVNAGLGLQPVPGTRVLQISYTSTDPRLSAQIANTFTEQYLVDQLESRLEATRSATDWLRQRVVEMEEQVEDDERAIEEARTRLSLEAGQGLEITQQQLNELSATLASLGSEITTLETQADRLRRSLDEGRDLGALSEFRDSETISRLWAEESTLLSRQVVLSEGHPARLRVTAQLEAVRRNIRAEAERIVSAVEIDLDAARDREAALVEDVRRLEDRALAQREQAVQLRQLEREADASRNLYEGLLNRLQEASQQDELQTANAHVLSPAVPSYTPIAASERRAVILGAVFGTMAGIVLVFVLDRLNNTFRSPAQLEQVTGRTVLATVPLVGSPRSREDVIRHVREKPNSSLSESIRNLRTSLLFARIDDPPKVVMFTSAVPGEGKSTTSMLTAITSQQMGKTSIIVDCDLRMPALAKMFAGRGADTGKGLLALLDGTASAQEAILQDPDTGLHMLMTKPSERSIGINAADVLSSNRFRDLIRELTHSYDLVVLDTPPTLIVTDARIVARLADAIVFVTRWHKTPRPAVLEGLRELDTVGAKVSGLVLTMVNEAKASRYAYGGFNYYKSKYRQYYQT